MNDLTEGRDPATLSKTDAGMLSYVRNLTIDPASIHETDIKNLRTLEFSDRAILEINLAAAYMNFVNRVAEGLGVGLEATLTPFTR